ncbi:hypothetical protein [Acetobacter malorum]|nr:hypothetical protein [Acetobacter malorum]
MNWMTGSGRKRPLCADTATIQRVSSGYDLSLTGAIRAMLRLSADG